MEGRYRKPVEPIFMAALVLAWQGARPRAGARMKGRQSLCPPSATHPLVAWSGAVCMLLAVTCLNFWPIDPSISHQALIVMRSPRSAFSCRTCCGSRFQRRTLVAAGRAVGRAV